MPIFEFNCRECERDFESFMKPHDPVECPNCKARISEMNEGGTIVRRFSVTANHIWNCSTDGATPKRGK